MRAPGTLATIALLLAGCAAPAATTEGPPKDPYEAFLADGWSPAGARLLADSTVEVVAANATYVELLHTLPFDVTMRVSYAFRAERTYEPTAEEAKSGHTVYDLRSELGEQDGKLQQTWSYFVPYTALPPKTVDALREEPTTASFLAIIGTAAASAEAPSGVEVVGKAVFSETVSTVLGKLDEFLSKRAGMDGGAVTQGVSSAGDVAEALSTLRPEHLAWIDKLRQARQCAQAPANPLTQKAYQEDPAYKERILDEIDAAIFAVKSTTFARFVGAEIKVGTPLLLASSPAASTVMSLVAAPVVAHSDAQLAAVNAERVAQIERLVQGFCSCGPSPSTGTSATGSAPSGGETSGGMGGPTTFPPVECRPGLLVISYTGSTVGTVEVDWRSGEASAMGSGSYQADYGWSASFPYDGKPFWGERGEMNATFTADYTSSMMQRSSSSSSGTQTETRCTPRWTVPFEISARAIGSGATVPFELHFQAAEFPLDTCKVTITSDGKSRTEEIPTNVAPMVVAGDPENPMSLHVVLRPGVDETIALASGGPLMGDEHDPSINLYCTPFFGFVVYEPTGTCTVTGTLRTQWT